MTPRDARPSDLAELGRIEVEGFPTDRLSQRSMRRLMTTPSAALRVLGPSGSVAGYHLTLFRAGSRIARLYSLVVTPEHRGKGAAATLLTDSETLAAQRGARTLRLEVREDNVRAIRFYARLGYRKIGRRPQYYADKANALRYEKALFAGESAEAVAGEEDRSPETIAGALQESMTEIATPAEPPSPRAEG